MTGFNIREENHIHKYIHFGFAGNSNNAIVINYCILHAKYYVYVEIPENKNEKSFNVDFFGYLHHLKSR